MQRAIVYRRSYAGSALQKRLPERLPITAAEQSDRYRFLLWHYSTDIGNINSCERADEPMCLGSLGSAVRKIRLLVNDVYEFTDAETYLSPQQTAKKSPPSEDHTVRSHLHVLRILLQLVIDSAREGLEYRGLRKHPKTGLL